MSVNKYQTTPLGRVAFSFLVLVLLFLSPPQMVAQETQPFVTGSVWGRLGNQMFIIAAVTSLALDHGAVATFPDYANAFGIYGNLQKKDNYELANMRHNFQHLFYHLKTHLPGQRVKYTYHEPSFAYAPIPYKPNMRIEGWFQSEKYFIHHKQAIIDLFAPPKKILAYLQTTYSDIINHPYTVSIHLRCYEKENPLLVNVYPTYGRHYATHAMRLFGPEAEYVVFSDKMDWAKKQLKGLPGKIRFIENEPAEVDFYLMSLCKHNIICNSTFSWWAAYLNQNPNKKVVVPSRWFTPRCNHDTRDLIPKEWIKME